MCAYFRSHMANFRRLREQPSGSYVYGFPELGWISGNTGAGFRGCTYGFPGSHERIPGGTGADFLDYGPGYRENAEHTIMHV